MELEALTAREALWKILALTHEPVTRSPAVVLAEVAKTTRDGLDRTQPVDFELSDQLADRLAEAHKLLAEIREGAEHSPSISSRADRIAEALALPPDLEAMIERRR
jgi:hypothetical protein